MLRKLVALVAVIIVFAGSTEVYGQVASTKSPDTSKKRVHKAPARAAITPPAVPSSTVATSKKKKRATSKPTTSRKITRPRAGHKRQTTTARRTAAAPRKATSRTVSARGNQVQKTTTSQRRVIARTARSPHRLANRHGARLRPGRMAAISAFRRPPPGDTAPRTLSFYNVHTQESLTVTYRRNGRYVPSALNRLNHFLRDSRNGAQAQMDPELFDILWLVRRRLRSTATYHVLSAYRSPATNAWLASVSTGVASNSRHMRGQAMDIMLPGRTAGQIRRAARALGLGGVGYYPRSGFVHLDTGPVRYW